MKRVRVLHIIDSFDQGGGQTVLLNLAAHADRSRFDVSVATMHGRGVCWNAFAALGIPLYSLSPRKWLPLHVLRLLSLLRRERFDVIHCHLFGANWIAKPLSALAGVPVRISHDHCNDRLRYDQPLALALDVWANRFSSHVCAVSASTYDFLVEKEKLPRDRVSLIYNGVDTERFTKNNSLREKSDPIILGMGRLHPQKNFSLFLDVAASVLEKWPRATFLIAGTGPQEGSLRQRANELGITERVKFLGHVSDPRPLFAQANLFLLTSDYEGTPMVVLEAMAAGTPLVASALDGISEALADGEDALLAEPGNRDAFVKCIDGILGQTGLAEILASKAHVKVQERYSAKAMARQIEAIYDRYLGDAESASVKSSN